jgi:hypothetical protein
MRSLQPSRQKCAALVCYPNVHSLIFPECGSERDSAPHRIGKQARRPSCWRKRSGMIQVWCWPGVLLCNPEQRQCIRALSLFDLPLRAGIVHWFGPCIAVPRADAGRYPVIWENGRSTGAIMKGHCSGIASIDSASANVGESLNSARDAKGSGCKVRFYIPENLKNPTVEFSLDVQLTAVCEYVQASPRALFDRFKVECFTDRRPSENSCL